ncbi:hypothetical protein G6F56_006631 [Rhizopus delemar]|nr:hypothetical protein G6F56_006631 [Rhizopus delemar]
MFDRADDTLFSRPLTRHKKEALSQIWEFGMPNKPLAIIEPPEQVFPKNSGGFVTTDIRNMLIYPNIIDTICEQIEKLNKDTVSHGQWKFVLPHTIFEQFQYIRGDEKRVQEVVIKLSLELSRGRITILKLWSKSSQEMDTVDFLKSVMLNYYKKLQFFVYADDMYYVLEKNRPFCLDFVNSTDIFLTFN